MEGKENKILGFFKKPLVSYIFSRIWHSAITMFLIIIAVFLLLRITPKERYIDTNILTKIPPAQRETYKENVYRQYGLDKPIHIQLLTYLRQVLPIPTDTCVRTGLDEDFNVVCRESRVKFVDFGSSAIFRRGEAVTDLIANSFPISFQITMTATLVAYAIGYPLGIVMAKNKNKLIDKLGNFYIVLTMAVPALVFYYIWQIISITIGLPSIFDRENYLTWITPIWAIAFLSLATQALWVRRFMVDELNSDYVKFARSKGISENKIMYKHIFRNALVPLVRNIPAALIFSVIGSYFVEQLWAIPGSGRLLISSLQVRDNPLVQGITIIYAFMSMTAFLLGDLVTAFFDPRISLEKNK